MDGSSHQHVADSTDWLVTSLPSFSTLEAALRCQVCKDFYDTPMMTSCSHTFCSLCIRRCLSTDGKCPACRAGDQASKLRRNWSVQEVVDAFKDSRQAALDLATNALAPSRNPIKVTNGQKRKRSDLAHDEYPTRETRRTRSQAQTPRSSEVVDLDAEEEGSDQDYVDVQSKPVVDEPRDGLVPCPICRQRMKEELVFSHLDKCTGSAPDPTIQLARTNNQSRPPVNHLSQPAPPATRIPQLNYSLLKDNALKRKLQELGIPAWGPRQLLIRRHTEWVDLFNANCDSTRPRPMRVLLQDLQNWERSQGGSAPQGNTFSTNGAGQNQIMAKDFDGEGWQERHKGQFTDLVAQARARAKAVKLKPENTPVDSETSTPTSVADRSALDQRHSGSVTPVRHPSVVSQRRRSSVNLPPDASPVARLFAAAADSLGSPASTPSRSPSLAGSTTDQAEGVRRVPMFQVPEAPVQDVDGSMESR